MKSNDEYRYQKKSEYRHKWIIDRINEYGGDDPYVLSIGWLENQNMFLQGNIVGVDNFCTPDNIRSSPVEGYETLLFGDCCDMIEISSGCFDVIEAGEVLEHIRDPVGFIVECHRVLRLGGIVVLSTPNGGNIYGNFRVDNGDVDSWHITLWNIPHLVNLFRKCGFELIVSKPYNPRLKISFMSRDVLLLFKKTENIITSEWIKSMMKK